MKINLNSRVTVKLTTTGLGALVTYNRQFRPSHRIKMGENSTVTMPLWEAMHIFGPACIMGFTPPFEDCELEVEAPV